MSEDEREDEEISTEGPAAGPRRGICTCGWRGHWRRAADCGWQAQADADDHYNAEHA